jgi:hypothetical protein
MRLLNVDFGNQFLNPNQAISWFSRAANELSGAVQSNERLSKMAHFHLGVKVKQEKPYARRKPSPNP